jgi:DNA repair exonuclease SbcCD ATPase subunit
MIIETVEIRNIGPFRGIVRVGPLSNGLNLLAANNEEGKTTVVKALVRGLFDRHTCRSEDIRDLQPAGTSLAPTVAIVFRLKDRAYKIEKTFLESPRSLLSQLVGDAWTTTDEGDKADERLQILLGSDQPGRGATKPEHWGLFQYLWARQGEPTTWPQWNGDSGKVVRSHLIKIDLDPLIENLKATLWATFAESFTDTGRPKVGGPLATSQNSVDDLRVQLQAIQIKVGELDSQQRTFERLGGEIAQLKLEATKRASEAEEIKQRAQEVERLQGELRRFEADLEAAQARLRAVETDEKSLAAAEATVKEAKARTEILQKRSEEVKTQESDILRRQGEGNQELQEGEAKRDRLRAGVERTEAILKCSRLQSELERLRKQAREVRSRESEVRRLDGERAKIPVLTPQRISKLETLHGDVVRIEAQIAAAGISAELTPERNANVDVGESGKRQKLEIDANTTENITAGQRLTLRLYGWGRIQVRSGAKELKDLENDLRTMRSDLSTALAELGVESVAEAHSLRERRKGIDEQLREAQRAFTNALGDFDTLAKLSEHIERATADVESLRRVHEVKPAEEALTLSELEAREEELKSKLKGAESTVREINNALRGLACELSAHQDERHGFEKELATLAGRQQNAAAQAESILARYPVGVPDAVKQAQDVFSDAKALVESAKRKLPSDAEVLPERNRRAAKAAADVQRELEQKQSERDKAAGALESLGSQGLYSQESVLTERIATEERKARAAQDRGWGARLLHDLIEHRKQEATRAVLSPLQDILSGRFAELTGVHTRRVFLDEQLQVCGVGQREEEIISFDQLSQGAKEQLLLSLRLGVALTLSEQERQSLILDDVLVNTDPVRQERVLDLLQSAARDLQILVLTCHPDRYRGIGCAVTMQPHQSNS